MICKWSFDSNRGVNVRNGATRCMGATSDDAIAVLLGAQAKGHVLDVQSNKTILVSRPAASSRAIRDQSRVGQCSCRMAPGTAGPPTNRRSDRSTSASGWPERAAQVRTRRTAPPDRPAADPNRFQSPSRGGMNQRFPSASTGCFSTQSARSGRWPKCICQPSSINGHPLAIGPFSR
jgi:hypothetical protein